MLKTSVLVSGGGTNLQALIDASARGKMQHVELSLVVSNRADAFALERAKRAGIRGEYVEKAGFEERLNALLDEEGIGLIVLAGFLRILSGDFTRRWAGRIINIHPSLIPSFCGAGYYGLRVHEAALADRAFCERDPRRGGDNRPARGGGPARRHAGGFAAPRDGAGGVDNTPGGRRGRCGAAGREK